MLNSTIINNKKILDTKMIDLFDGVFVSNLNIPIDKSFIVPEKYNKRPDMVCVMAYGVDDFTDLLMKFNGISNPLSVSSGTLIVVPNITKLLELGINKTESKNGSEGMKQLKEAYLSKLTEKEKEKIKSIVKSEGFTPSDNLIPSFVNPTPETPQVSVENGVVRFGSKVLSGEESIIKCGTPVTKAEWLTGVIKKKLKGV